MSRSNIAPDCDNAAEDCPADTTAISVYETGTNNVVFGRAIELVTDVDSDYYGSALFLLGGGSIATLTWTDREGTSHMRSRISARNWRAPIILGTHEGAGWTGHVDGVSASSGKSVFVGWTATDASSFKWNVSTNSGSKFSRSKNKADSTYDSAQIRSVWPIGAKFGVAVYRWESWDGDGDYAVTDIYTATASSALKRWSMRLGEICVGGVYVESKVLVVGRLETTVLTWDDDLEEFSESSTYSLYSYTSAP
jgi:hypothetical protein